MTEPHDAPASPRPPSDLLAERMLAGEIRTELRTILDTTERSELLIVACGYAISSATSRVIWNAWFFGLGVGIILGLAAGGSW